MYAFGPAIGFGLSALCNHLYADLGSDVELSEYNPNWVGAWWLGFLICSGLYLIAALPLFFFPKSLMRNASAADETEMNPLRIGENSQNQTTCRMFWKTAAGKKNFQLIFRDFK